MIDRAADAGRRVWCTCPQCEEHPPLGCYMIGYEGGRIWAQCPTCWHRFWYETGFGHPETRTHPDLWWPDPPEGQA